MKETERCPGGKPETGCHSVQDIQTIQPFPNSGLLHKNANLPLPDLFFEVRKERGQAYSYVARSVKLNHETFRWEQHGSGPNFQGGVLTLCTCKHQMRSRLSAEQWQDNVWIAGFTSRTIHEGKHWLFYLAKIKSAYESHSDLWSINADIRKEKAAHLHYLGDLFKPITPKPTGDARFSPSRYLTPPVHAHRQSPGDTGWHNDIHYQHAATARRPPLLVADPRQTFLWEEPMIFFADDHCRDYHKWPSGQELLAKLRQAR